MPPNFPGATNIRPEAYSETISSTTGIAFPGGSRQAALLGEGERRERLISSARGRGLDGLNSDYTSTTGSDGRHFKVSFAPLIPNRSRLVRNGAILSGLEQEFDSLSSSFSSIYDYRFNVTNGKIELQTASLLDQGGSYFSSYILNVGNGILSGLSLLDIDAPTETWTIRCTSVRRDGYGDIVPGYAKFIAQGSVSGILLDGYGNKIVWTSDGIALDNTILQFSIQEGSVYFQEGDRFIVKVKSGALSAGESLVFYGIGEADLNDPTYFADPNELYAKHGLPSTTNTLSLAAQLAFANGAPGVWACQCSPAIPRRQSFVLETSASGGAVLDDLMFPLPSNVIPDSDSQIYFFITDTSKTESQILPNKVDFYNSGYTSSPASFCLAETYSYTVILQDAVLKNADDGSLTSIGPTSATLSSISSPFTILDLGKEVKILEPSLNAGTYIITAVASGIATITDGSSSFTDETEIEFEVIDVDAQSAKILLTSDLAPSAGYKLRATVVDSKDSSFYDANWQTAFEALEKIDVDIIAPFPTQTISSIFGAALSHVEQMSQIAEGRERILLIGSLRGLTPQNLYGEDLAAVEDIGILEGIQGDDIAEILSGNSEDLTDYSIINSYGQSYRVGYFAWPDEIIVQVGGTRVTMPGFYMAAAAAGYFSSVANIAVPLTKKTLKGFAISRTKLLRPQIMDKLLRAGGIVLEPVAAGGKAVWGRTTKQGGDPNEEELSVVFIRDKVSKTLRATMEPFIGRPEDRGFQNTLQNTAYKAGQAFLSANWITKFKDVQVSRDKVEPRQWNVQMAVQPTYPVNWIYIPITVGIQE